MGCGVGVLGAEHAYTLRAASALGHALTSQASSAEAEGQELLRATYAKQLDVLGKAHVKADGGVAGVAQTPSTLPINPPCFRRAAFTGVKVSVWMVILRHVSQARHNNWRTILLY